MSIRLSHQEEAAQVIVLTTQITDHDAGRNSSQAHQSSETGGVMFAKPNATMKQKLFQVVVPIFAWRQRITESLRPEKVKRAVYFSARIGILSGPGLH